MNIFKMGISRGSSQSGSAEERIPGIFHSTQSPNILSQSVSQSFDFCAGLKKLSYLLLLFPLTGDPRFSCWCGQSIQNCYRWFSNWFILWVLQGSQWCQWEHQSPNQQYNRHKFVQCISWMMTFWSIPQYKFDKVDLLLCAHVLSVSYKFFRYRVPSSTNTSKFISSV